MSVRKAITKAFSSSNRKRRYSFAISSVQSMMNLLISSVKSFVSGISRLNVYENNYSEMKIYKCNTISMGFISLRLTKRGVTSKDADRLQYFNLSHNSVWLYSLSLEMTAQ